MARRFRSVFLSDIHLGNPGCQAGMLLEFLRDHEADRIYLVGDIVDFEYLERSLFWAQSHTEVLKHLLGAARRGVEVIYVPGNHDERLRAFCGRRIGGIRVERFHVHTSVAGQRYLVLHGDEFDGLLDGGRLARIGAFAYRNAIRLHTRVNRLGGRLGFGYTPLATFLKHRFGSARGYMDRFRATVVATAAGCDVAGVVCGHIHRPEDRQVGAIRYLNTGDWVENCTAVVERIDGSLGLVDWPAELRGRRQRQPAASSAMAA